MATLQFDLPDRRLGRHVRPRARDGQVAGMVTMSVMVNSPIPGRVPID
jgi:hypothetical protein